MKLVTFIIILSTGALLQGQEDYHVFDDEDVVTMSKFEVVGSSARSYSYRSQYDPRNRGGSGSRNPIKLLKRADCVMLKLTVSSEAKMPEDRIKGLQEAYQLLKSETLRSGKVLFRSGFVELPIVEGRRGFSSYKKSEEVSSFDVTLIAKMGEEDTIFDRTEFLNSFLNDIDFDRSIKVYFVSTGIGLLKSANLRMELIGMIGDEAQLMKKTFGEDISLRFEGLDQKIQIRQINDVNLEVFIPYSMVLQTGKD